MVLKIRWKASVKDTIVVYGSDVEAGSGVKAKIVVYG